jgi:ATP-binding cassette subfamily F protein 3
VLTEALAGFPGTAVFVSHNEYFISRIANRIVEMRPGVFKDFPGSIANYRSFLEAGYMQSDEAAPASSKGPSGAETAKQGRIQKKEERRQTQRRIEKLEKDIDKMEAEMKAADEILNNPANASNYGLLHDTAMVFEGLKKKNEKLVVEWEELQVKLATYEEI